MAAILAYNEVEGFKKSKEDTYYKIVKQIALFELEFTKLVLFYQITFSNIRFGELFLKIKIYIRCVEEILIK